MITLFFLGSAMTTFTIPLGYMAFTTFALFRHIVPLLHLYIDKQELLSYPL